MTRPHFRQLGVTAVFMVTVFIPGRALAQEASASVTAVGWWSRSPAQQAPTGGFAVANAPDGPVTVAALVLDTGEAGVLTATLEAVETGGIGGEAAAVQVCPAADGWAAESGAALDDAPEADCESASVAFERDAEAEVWTADLLPLLSGRTGIVSLALVPGEAAEGALPAVAFDVRFAKPSLDAVAGTPASAEVTEEEASADIVEFASPPPPESAAQPAAPVSDGAVDLPALATPDPTSDGPLPAAGAPDVVEETPVDEQAGVFQSVGTGADGEGRRWGQALSFALVSAAAGCIAGFGRRFLRTRAA